MMTGAGTLTFEAGDSHADSEADVRSDGTKPASAGPVLCLSLELDLTAELEQAPTHDLVRFQPRRTVPGILRENRRAVERVVNVEIPAHPGLAEAENPGDADVELLKPIFVNRVCWNQVDVHIGGACRSAPARPDVSTQQGRDLRVRSRIARHDRDVEKIVSVARKTKNWSGGRLNKLPPERR